MFFFVLMHSQQSSLWPFPSPVLSLSIRYTEVWQSRPAWKVAEGVTYVWLAPCAAEMLGCTGLQVKTGYLLAKEKGSQTLVTCKGQHYQQIDHVVTIWEYLKGFMEAPLPLKHLRSSRQPSRLSQSRGSSSHLAAALWWWEPHQSQSLTRRPCETLLLLHSFAPA